MDKKLKISLIIFTFLTLGLINPLTALSSPTPSPGEVSVRVDGVEYNRKELEGKIDFLPIISSKNVSLEVGLTGCLWGNKEYVIEVENEINNSSSEIIGKASNLLLNCGEFFSGTAVPANYTIYYESNFNGQSVKFNLPVESYGHERSLETRVFEDVYRDASSYNLNNKFSGYIMLKPEDEGRAYYISPRSKKAYYLAIPKISFQVMRGTGLGITNEDLAKIPVGGKCPSYMENCAENNELDQGFTNKYLGYILLQVEENGEAWYIYPEDRKRYFLGTPEDAYEIMKNKSWGISNNDFEKVELAY